jgi:hypothetical protein
MLRATISSTLLLVLSYRKSHAGGILPNLIPLCDNVSGMCFLLSRLWLIFWSKMPWARHQPLLKTVVLAVLVVQGA